jgi:neutral ceramidase
MTRTTLSVLRIGDYVVGTMPGELTVILADYIRRSSPVGQDKTIVLGYAQGHVGYLMSPEDWLLGGYESSVTFWGPLEGEYLAAKLVEMLPLAVTPIREDGAMAGATKLATATMTDDFEIDAPAMLAGTVPATVPTTVWSRVGILAQAQPAAQVPRVSGNATFVWIGDDPSTKTPRVTLQGEASPGVWLNVSRRSGRAVEDGEIVLAYTPNPLQRSGPQTHYWVAEWQAVPYLGIGTVDALDDRGGVPLGNYRFHVEGSGWTLDSAAFEVVTGGLAPTASRVGGAIRTTARWHAPTGFRLMDMTLQSNQPVPLRSQAVTIELRDGTTVLGTSTDVMTDANGVVQVDDNAAADNVRVIDRFGNDAVVNL